MEATTEGKCRTRSEGTVTESIYSSATVVIPLADVSYVVRREFGIQVVTKHTTYNLDIGDYNNAAWIHKDEAPAFLSAWCRYRSELEADTLANLEPCECRRPTPEELSS